MNKTNCANCGAPKDVEQIVCPFCGTRYINLVDLASNEDIFVQLPMPDGEIVTKRAYVCEKSFQLHDIDKGLVYDKHGRLCRPKVESIVSGKLSFVLYDPI